MSAIAARLARVLWFYMLWLMRRPWMKALQRRSMGFFRVRENPRKWEHFKKQNRWARRWGLPMLVFSINLLLGSVLLTFTYLTAINLYTSGALQVPEKPVDYALERATRHSQLRSASSRRDTAPLPQAAH
jgi:hypothetical protein